MTKLEPSENFLLGISWICVRAWPISFKASTKTVCREKSSAPSEKVSRTRKGNRIPCWPSSTSCSCSHAGGTDRRPQPVAWFRNLITCLGDKVKIRVASKDGCPVASMLTLRHKQVLVYKYGCSDHRFNHLGGTLLFSFWKAIQGAKDDQLFEFDQGRSDCGTSGLIAFKDRWAAARSSLTYSKFPLRRSQSVTAATQAPIVKYLFARVPDRLLVAAGRVLYKHVG